MKKAFCIAALLIFASALAFGQLGISKGIKGGLNFATVGGSDAPPSLSTMNGFAAGVYLELSLPGPLSIQPEVLYSIKGFKLDLGALGSSTNTYSYVDIPVLLKFSLPVPVVKPFIFVGPSLSLLLSAKEKDESPIAGRSGETDIKDVTNKTDFGVVAGAGIKLSLVAVDLSIDARYAMGLSKFDKSDAKIYHRVFAVYLGVGF